MRLAVDHAEFLVLPPPPLHKRAIPSRHHHRPWKRRRLKPLTLHSHLNPTPSPFEHLFQSLLSQFPSVSTLSYIAPTLGFASGLALYLSRNSNSPKQLPNPGDSSNVDVGEWILFASPTPFNRFVTLRCPSICFPGNELLEDVNEKLVKEDRHYVKLNTGRMIERLNSGGEVSESMVYQRICVSTEDGGVLSLDWPANLELEQERGLDTTVLIVPGTAEGSNERMIRLFVSECLRRGFFPFVMNPRGCAGSPLTTARLFTAADSDDISTVVQFINKKRPWTTLMGVGWGYGASMLTKYLAEFGERTPLTAATCIDNPFDLEETARSSVHHLDFGQRHTSGLISILQRNKALFQGRGKSFNVEKALSASSIRDFEEAISMLSYGFDSIEDFYEQSSTRNMIGEVKIPVLFIQDDGVTTPLFSVPRGLIAANPYTSLLLCSYSPTNKFMGARSTSSWCHHLILEWLAAVELGILKGRHPLLKDVDFSINPSKSLALMETEASSRNGRTGTLLNLTNGNSMCSPLEMSEAHDASMSSKSRSTQEKRQSPKEDDGVSCQSSTAIDAEVATEETNSRDDERGQVLASTQVVINMLDVTMPEVLSDEQKKKVLNAVGQGETLIKALQDAVPEDVRGKLTSAVSGILQSQGSGLKFDKLVNLEHIPDMASGLNSKLPKIRQAKPNGDTDVHFSDQEPTINDPGDGSAIADYSSDKPPENADLQNQSSKELQNHSSDNSKKPNDTGSMQPTTNNGSYGSDVEEINQQETGNSGENEQLSMPRASDVDNVSELNAKSELASQSEGPGGTEDVATDQKVVEKDGVEGQSDQMENNKHKHDLSTDQNTVSEAHQSDDQHLDPPPASETQVMESETEGSPKEEREPLSVSNQNSAAPPSFNVSQALDALTGFDDSTQVAVNSVFHVVEDMIDQLEVEKDGENEVINENNKREGWGLDEAKEQNSKLPKSERSESLEDETKRLSGGSDGTVLHDSACSEDKYEQWDQAYDSSNSHDTSNTKPLDTENLTSVASAAEEPPEVNFGELLNNNSQKFPSHSIKSPHGESHYKEYLKSFPNSKLRKAEPPESDTMSALYLNYIPEEGKWKLLEEQPADDSVFVDELRTSRGGYKVDRTNLHARSKHTGNIIEPSYVILDSGKPVEGREEHMETHDNIQFDLMKFDRSMRSIKSIVLDRLNVEVCRKASAANEEGLELKLARDTEQVADAVSLAVEHAKLQMGKENDNLSDKLCTLDGESIIKAISSAYQDTQYLKRVLPVGVVVGSTLAALRKLSNDSAADINDEKHLTRDPPKSTETVETILTENENKVVLRGLNEDEDEDKVGHENSKNSKLMVGAVTAALGASALFVHQQTTETDGTLHELLEDKQNSKEPSKIGEMPDRAQNNIVTSLAEKAMSVASPVVPTKGDGRVDQERLVAMLAELGQKGGVLKLVGKVALLWGGIRGAMSLTDKLISFLCIDERPLYQRILGFGFMVLLLWSPVIVPLLPSLMQSWATHNKPLKIVELTCIASLYISIIIMVNLWGKRVRKYDDPLQKYGLDLASLPKFQIFLKGLVGGVILVVLIHSLNSSLGCVHLRWPTTLSSLSSEPVILLTSYGRMFLLILQGIATATGVATVEELLFRSWLPQEIGADLGYNQGIIISGLIYALLQRSMWEIPGLWLLSLSLAGARQRNEGSLSLPIGLRTGMLASNFILKTGGFLTSRPNYPLWITGGHPFQPFSGVVGLAFMVVLAIILYPRQQPIYRRKTARAIRP